jgi:glycerol-1-phosphate dehydrogenase [NAD(P)+]
MTSARAAVADLAAVAEQVREAPAGLGLGGVLLGSGVLAALPEVVAELGVDHGEIALLADCRPMAGAEPDIKTAIEEQLRAHGRDVRRVTIGDADAHVHADAATLEAATSSCQDAELLISVGSGTVADVGKAVSARLPKLAHVVVQTAASVNGFADDQSVLLVEGVKRTTATRWPDRLVIDTDVLALAPPALNRAGLGDLMATFTAPADWLLASFVGQDASYSPAVVALARRHIDALLDAAPGIGAGDPAALEALAGTLTLSGISMGVAGRTSPGSGMEHTVSHLLEMADHDGAAPLHGAKVGVLSVLAALLWEHVRTAGRAGALERLRFPATEEMERRVHSAFSRLDPSGGVAGECWSDYALKLQRWHDSAGSIRTLPARWSAIDARLDELLAPPQRLIGALRAAGAPTRLSELGVDGTAARWALANCHLMRDRFTVADLAFLMGLWEADDVDRLLDEAAALGAGL